MSSWNTEELRQKAADLRQRAFQTEMPDYQIKLLNLARLLEIRASLRDENSTLRAKLEAPIGEYAWQHDLSQRQA